MPSVQRRKGAKRPARQTPSPLPPPGGARERGMPFILPYVFLCGLRLGPPPAVGEGERGWVFNSSVRLPRHPAPSRHQPHDYPFEVCLGVLAALMGSDTDGFPPRFPSNAANWHAGIERCGFVGCLLYTRAIRRVFPWKRPCRPNGPSNLLRRHLRHPERRSRFRESFRGA